MYLLTSVLVISEGISSILHPLPFISFLYPYFMLHNFYKQDHEIPSLISPSLNYVPVEAFQSFRCTFPAIFFFFFLILFASRVQVAIFPFIAFIHSFVFTETQFYSKLKCFRVTCTFRIYKTATVNEAMKWK